MTTALQSPLARVVGRTPLQPATFTLLRQTWWTEDGWIVVHERELPAGLREQLVGWASANIGRRMPR